MTRLLGVRRASTWIGAVLAVLSARPAEVTAFDFSIEPARVELAVPAGKRRGKTVVINNSKSDHATHLTVYVRDVLYLPDGTHDFPPPGSTEWSCASWLQATPTELDVPAGQMGEVRISALAPADAVGGHYAIVFFETAPAYEQGSIGVNFRVGALVEVLVPGTEVQAAKLANLSFLPPKMIQADVFNEGNALIRPKGKIKIFDGANQRVAQITFNPNRLGVLPKTLRTFPTTLETPLTSGTYRVRAELDYGTKQLLVGELQTTVP